MKRRDLLKTFSGAALVCGAAETPPREGLLRYLESLRKQGGAYGWASESLPHLTPTYFVVGCYHLLDLQPPSAPELAAWIRSNNPLPKRRHEDRPLRRFWFEQIQTLQWLNQDASGFAKEIAAWLGPIEFTTRYELGGNPVFQQEVHALRCRALLGLDPTPQWKQYVLSRQRLNGTFNTTPGSDGSDGHVMNTLWGLQALRVIGEATVAKDRLSEWIQACQLPSGGFTYAPAPTIAPIDDIAYTWAALKALAILGAEPRDRQAATKYIYGLSDGSNGLAFRDREDRQPSPMATFYALDSLKALGAELPRGGYRLPTVVRGARRNWRVFTIQIEAPGKGSPAEAVEMARALGIHLWAAKNTAPGWIERAQAIAYQSKVAVEFCVGDEEYGTYFGLPGLGTYSHLVDFVAPDQESIGPAMAPKQAHIPWEKFRDDRLRRLQAGDGRLIWQFNENEELTRVLLDDAVASGSYSAIASFHFGNEDFRNTQPFLMRYEGVLPFIGLQDNHAAEPWWWGDQLEGFRTVFLAEDPSWEAWLDALKGRRVMAIRHDAVTNFQTQYAGGDSEVRAVVDQWWKARRSTLLRPAALVTAVRADEEHDEHRPQSGVRLRVRCLHGNTSQGLPQTERAKLVRLLLNGKEVQWQTMEQKNDRYHYVDVTTPGRHTAEVVVHDSRTQSPVKLRSEFTA